MGHRTQLPPHRVEDQAERFERDHAGERGIPGLPENDGRGSWAASVMIPCLQKVDAIGADQVHEPMLLRDAAGPRVRGEVAQRLRLADATKRILHDCFDETEDSQRHTPVCLNPIP